MTKEQEAQQAQTLGRLRAVIEQTLKNYRMRNVQIDDSDEGLPLVDMLTPKGAGSIACGLEEIDQITDDLIDSVIEIVDSQAQKIAELQARAPKQYTEAELREGFASQYQDGLHVVENGEFADREIEADFAEWVECARFLGAIKEPHA